MIYFAIRVAVASAIMIAFFTLRNSDSQVATFVMALGAALASQAVAFGAKLLARDEARTNRSLALLAASALAAIACVGVVLAL